MSTVVELVSQYREIKTRAMVLESEMKRIKDEIEPLVKANGNWQDKEGYARLTTTQPSLSFDAKAVGNLMKAWQLSDDAVMHSCGDLLAQYRQEKHGSTYLSVK